MNRIFKEAFSTLLPNNKLLLLYGPKGLDNISFVVDILSEKSLNYTVIDLSDSAIRGEINKLKNGYTKRDFHCVENIIKFGTPSFYIFICL